MFEENKFFVTFWYIITPWNLIKKPQSCEQGFFFIKSKIFHKNKGEVLAPGPVPFNGNANSLEGNAFFFVCCIIFNCSWKLIVYKEQKKLHKTYSFGIWFGSLDLKVQIVVIHPLWMILSLLIILKIECRYTVVFSFSFKIKNLAKG